MPYKVKRIVVEIDYQDNHLQQIFEVDHEIDYPYIVGEEQSLIPDDAVMTNFRDSEDPQMYYETPIFNAAGLTKRTVEVGKNGLYYLFVRPDHKLDTIIVEPDEVVSDILYTPVATKGLIYSFYNPTASENITVIAHISKDDEEIYQKIKADPDDIIYRQYFIRRALADTRNSKAGSPAKQHPEIMNAEQVGAYLDMQEKTIRNWTSADNIPHTKIQGAVRYRKSDIDEWLDQNTSK